MSRTIVGALARRSAPGVVAVVAVIAVAANGCGRAKTVCSSKQAEAKATLQALGSLQARYFADHKTYARSIDELKLPVERSHPYSISVDTASPTAYRATAAGKDDMLGDVWKVDETGTVSPLTDTCSAM